MNAKRLVFTNLIFLLFAVVLLLLSYLSYQRVNKQAEASGWVDHTYKVKVQLANAVSTLYKAESAQRGYILTKDRDLLKQYIEAKETIPKILTSLDTLITDNRVQEENLAGTKKLFFLRIVRLDTVINNMNSISTSNMDTLLIKGKKLTESISRRIDLMTKLEDMLLRKRLSDRNTEEKMSSTFILFFSVLSIIVLLFAFLRLKKESRLLDASVIDKNILEKIVTERTSELLSANSQLNLQNAELEKINAELNSFTFIASHDLKEPLRKIEMYSSKLLKEDEEHLSQNGKNFLKKITDSIQRMRNLIDSIFSYAQVEQQLHKEHANLADAVNRAVYILAETINEKKAEVLYNGLPTIIGAPEQMEQLFTNLIGNALKYSRKDIPPKINITADSFKNGQKETMWKIEVTDNGVGFDNLYKEKIFQIFQRAHSKTQYPGTGIGLAICRKIVENHHGTISARSIDGTGAVFTIIIPEEVK